MWRNDTTCKCMFMFLLKNLAHNGLLIMKMTFRWSAWLSMYSLRLLWFQPSSTLFNRWLHSIRYKLLQTITPCCSWFFSDKIKGHGCTNTPRRKPTCNDRSNAFVYLHRWVSEDIPLLIPFRRERWFDLWRQINIRDKTESGSLSWHYTQPATCHTKTMCRACKRC